MNNFVEVIVNHFAEIHDIILVHLVLPVLLDFKPTVMQLTEISDIISTILSNNRKLRVVHLFLIRNTELVGVVFTNLEVHLRTFHFDLLADQVFRIARFNLKHQARALVSVVDFEEVVERSGEVSFDELERA